MPSPYIQRHNPITEGKSYKELLKEDVEKYKLDPKRGTPPEEAKPEPGFSAYSLVKGCRAKSPRTFSNSNLHK